MQKVSLDEFESTGSVKLQVTLLTTTTQRGIITKLIATY